MQIEYDPAKRQATLQERNLDFEDARLVFAGPTAQRPDNRKNYGEQRIISYGTLRGRMVVIVWTPRAQARRIISMRYANDREIALHSQLQARP